MNTPASAATLIEKARSAVRQLAPYNPGKPLQELERELGISDAIKLASNENPLGCSEQVRAVIANASADLNRYPDGNGFALKATLAEHLGVTAEQITLGNGSNDVLELLARTFVAPGDKGVVDAHSFVVYPLAITSAGGELVRVPSRDHGHDLAAMADAVDASVRIVFVANPNNPTGTWVERTSLEQFLQQVPKDVLVVLDEAYFEYVDADDYPDGLTLLPAYPNLVVTRTFSKIHGLAGLRVGYAVSHPDIADLLNRLRQPFNVNSLAQEAAICALGDTDYLQASKQMNRAGMQSLGDALTQRQIPVIPSAGNFIMLQIPASTGLKAATVYEMLLRQGVIVRPLANYHLPDFLRVSIGLPEENERFIAALDQVLGQRR